MTLTYAEAGALLAPKRQKGRRKIARNTWLHTLPDDRYAIRLHDTDIIVLHPNDTFTLNSGGWRTQTTKERISRFGPASVASMNGIWYVGDAIFHDKILVNDHGAPIGLTPNRAEVERLKRKLDKEVRQYIQGYADHVVARGGLELPGNGDCWGCLFSAREENNNGKANDQPMGHDHLLEHFREKYYVPSLLWKALQRCGNPVLVWSMIDSEVKRGDTRYLSRTLTSCFRKLKPHLLDLYQEASHDKS